MKQVNDVESAIDFIVETCDPDNPILTEALRISLYDKLNYRVGNFLQLEDSKLLSLTDEQLGALTREILHAMEDVECEGFSAYEIATLNKMLREYMGYYHAVILGAYPGDK